MNSHTKSTCFKSIGLLFLLIAVCLSCVKEEDIIVTSAPVVIAQEGSTKLVSGVVKDTTNARIPEASIKMVLGDLELETEADENGEWELTIPNSFSEGYIVVHKLEYAKTIQRYVDRSENQTENTYLLRDANINVLDLSIRINNLKIVRGRIIDENGTPTPDIRLLVFSVSNGSNTPTEFTFSAYQTTQEDGIFEMVFEDEGFDSNTLIAFNGNGCGETFDRQLESNELIEDLGDLQYSFQNISTFEASVETIDTSCYDNASSLSYFMGVNSFLVSINVDQPIGDISLEFCPEENGAFYVGVESDDKTEFNGLFFSPTEIEDSYALDICTPNEGEFLELSIDENSTIYEENLSYERVEFSDSRVRLQEQDIQINMVLSSIFSSFSPATNQTRYQIGLIESLSLQGNIPFLLNDSFINLNLINHMTIVQDDDDFYAGIAQTKVMETGGLEKNVRLRFRVRK